MNFGAGVVVAGGVVEELVGITAEVDGMIIEVDIMDELIFLEATCPISVKNFIVCNVPILDGKPL